MQIYELVKYMVLAELAQYALYFLVALVLARTAYKVIRWLNS